MTHCLKIVELVLVDDSLGRGRQLGQEPFLLESHRLFFSQQIGHTSGPHQLISHHPQGTVPNPGVRIVGPGPELFADQGLELLKLRPGDLRALDFRMGNNRLEYASGFGAYEGGLHPDRRVFLRRQACGQPEHVAQ